MASWCATLWLGCSPRCGPCCALGSSAQRWMQAPLAATIEEAQRWRLSGVEVLGDDVCVDYDVDDGDGVGGEESAAAGEGRSCSCCD